MNALIHFIVLLLIAAAITWVSRNYFPPDFQKVASAVAFVFAALALLDLVAGLLGYGYPLGI
jgi:hypothetical protein